MSGDIGKDDHNVWDGSRDTHQDKSYEQLEGEVAALKEEIEELKKTFEKEIFGEGMLQMFGDNIRELKTSVKDLMQENERLQQMLSAGTSKTTQRAYLLSDALKTARGGFITRSQARSILAEDGVKLHIKTTTDAMMAAAKLFGYVYTKNTSGRVILRLK
jgi:uncharacterized protein YoxC